MTYIGLFGAHSGKPPSLQALTECGGDMDEAMEWLKKTLRLNYGLGFRVQGLRFRGVRFKV